MRIARSRRAPRAALCCGHRNKAAADRLPPLRPHGRGLAPLRYLRTWGGIACGLLGGPRVLELIELLLANWAFAHKLACGGKDLGYLAAIADNAICVRDAWSGR